MQKLMIVFLATIFSFNTFAQDFSKWVEEDLLKIQASNSSRMTSRQIKALNNAEFEKLEKFIPDEVVTTHRGTRLNGLSREWAERVVASINPHPVVSMYQYAKYNNRGVEIGFCFGRATYIHLALIRMGIHKDAIKKIWAVGPMNTGIQWAFHVATVVKGENDGQWWVVDDYPGKVLEPRAWFEHMSKANKDGKLQVFISEPEKFSVSIGKYDRVQLGLDLTRDEDWYSHYFADLMAWFSKGDGILESVGLKDLRKGKD